MVTEVKLISFNGSTFFGDIYSIGTFITGDHYYPDLLNVQNLTPTEY